MDQTTGSAEAGLEAALSQAATAVAVGEKIQSSKLRAALDKVAGPDYEIFAAGVMTDGRFWPGNREARTFGSNSYLVAVDLQMDLTGEYAVFRPIPVNRANISLQSEGPGAHHLSGKLAQGDQIVFLARGNAYDVKGGGIGAITGLIKSSIRQTLRSSSNTRKNVFVRDEAYVKAKSGAAARALEKGASLFKALLGV